MLKVGRENVAALESESFYQRISGQMPQVISVPDDRLPGCLCYIELNEDERYR